MSADSPSDFDLEIAQPLLDLNLACTFQNCFRTRWTLSASKGLLGFSPSRKLQRGGGQPSEYEISELNGEEGVLSLETL